MALGSGNWVIIGKVGGTSGTPLLHENTRIEGKERILNLRLKMGASGYPAAGIPLPSFGSLGFYRNVDYQMAPTMSTGVLASNTVLFAVQNTTTGGPKMHAFKCLASGTGYLQTCTGVLGSAQNFYLTARGW